jgi:DNA-binding response OmpR family regulator
MSGRAEPKEKMIFVVDDDPVFLNSSVDFFTREGFRTGSAVDGEEALKKIAQEKPNLIILDLLLPKLSGYEIIKKLQEDYFTKSIPIFVVTIKKLDAGTKQMFSMESNVKEFFNKPINLHVLIQRIHQFLHTIPKDEKILEEYRKRVDEEKK